MRRRIVWGVAAALVLVTLAVAFVARRGDDGSQAQVAVVFDGQSLNNTPVPPHNYPTLLMTGRDEPWSNVAVNGSSWDDLAASASTRLDPKATMAERTVLVLNGGTADILAGDSGQKLYDDEVDYARRARAAGFDVVIATTLVGNKVNDPDQDAARRDHNDLLRADAEDAFDAVVDLDATALSDWTSTTYFTIDHVHWKQPGAQLAADTVEPVLVPFLG